MGKLVRLEHLIRIRRALGRQGATVVFTNGTFDILHRGHVEYLARAKKLGDVLIVGLNTDASIRRIKGEGRPVNPNRDRAAVLGALQAVDYICMFAEDTPERLIARIVPDVLVKGADWSVDAIVGKEIVERHGGRVRTIRLTPGKSTTGVIERILRIYAPGGKRSSPRRRMR